MQLHKIFRRAAFLSMKSRELRASVWFSATAEKSIQAKARELFTSLERWRQLPLIMRAETESKVRSDLSSSLRILEYPALTYSDRSLVQLLNEYRAAIIFNSLIVTPKPGPKPNFRFSQTLNIFRTIHVDGKRSTTDVWVLFIAGMALGPSNKREKQWLTQTLESIDKNYGYPSASRAAFGLDRVWARTESHDRVSFHEDKYLSGGYLFSYKYDDDMSSREMMDELEKLGGIHDIAGEREQKKAHSRYHPPLQNLKSDLDAADQI